MASTALTGQRSQPTDAARQLFIVDDTALTGHTSHSAATHEVSTGTAPSALTGQRGQPTEAARQPFWHGSSGPNGTSQGMPLKLKALEAFFTVNNFILSKIKFFENTVHFWSVFFIK